MTTISKIAAERRGQILDAALKDIEKSGLNNVTLRSVALTAGLSKGGITHYYSSKNELIIDTFKYCFKGIVLECERQIACHEEPLDKLFTLDIFFKTDLPIIKVAHPILCDFMSMAAHDPLCRKIFDDWIEVWIKMLTKILNDGIVGGSISPCDVDSKARMISSVIHGIAVRTYLAPDSHSLQWAVDVYQDFIIKVVSVEKNQNCL